MVKPIPPTAPEAPLRSDAAFSTKAQTFLTWLSGVFYTYVGAAVDYVDARADEALAAATTFGFPSIAGKALNFTRVNAAGTALEFRTAAQVRSDLGVAAWTQVGPFSTGSGTAFDVNSIPDGVTEIEILFDFVSLSGTDAILVQLGAFGVGTLDGTGYLSARTTFSGTTIPTATVVDDTSNGFNVRLGAAAAAVTGTMRLVRGSNATLWHYTLTTSLDSTTMQIGSGRKYLSTSRLSDLRITRSGFNTFDNGLISVRYR